MEHSAIDLGGGAGRLFDPPFHISLFHILTEQEQPNG